MLKNILKLCGGLGVVAAIITCIILFGAANTVVWTILVATMLHALALGSSGFVESYQEKKAA